jgi:hypothetical protein
MSLLSRVVYVFLPPSFINCHMQHDEALEKDDDGTHSKSAVSSRKDCGSTTICTLEESGALAAGNGPLAMSVALAEDDRTPAPDSQDQVSSPRAETETVDEQSILSARSPIAAIDA